MARVVVIGAGFAGHTAAMYLGDDLKGDHQVTVVNPQDYFLFIPSLVWVGTGRMNPDKTHFPIEPVYRKMGVSFVHGRVTEVHPDEQFVLANPVSGGDPVKLDYDYLVIATGPKLNFEGTENLGPDHGHTYSICNLPHATQARDKYLESVARMEKGEKQRIVIGTGHPGATCQGAAFEYISNIQKDLVRRNLRDKAELTWVSNERALGDFGVRGVQVRSKNGVSDSEQFIKMIFDDYDIKWEVQKGVTAVDGNKIYWQDFDGNDGDIEYDYSVLLPQFKGIPIKYVGADGSDVSAKIVNAAGFVLVDGIYGLPYDQLVANPDAWPGTYQNPNYKNIFSAGIAFAPPGPISAPHTNPKGMMITAAPPRTGMVSGIIGRLVARNISELIKKGRMTHSERMTEMFAACIASMGDSLWDGAAATIVIYPVVPDQRRFPNEQGRDLFVTHMEMGLAGAWMKRVIHTTFMYKFRGYPGWTIIPE
jgi:sulfide:quinone oxidoreductase